MTDNEQHLKDGWRAAWEAWTDGKHGAMYQPASFCAGWTAAIERSRWVAVERELPTVEGEYLTQKRDGEIAIRWFNPSMSDYDHYCRTYYAAWMNKPEPYTPKEAK